MARRKAGLLLHPTSLPGPYGVGDLGPAADRFLDWAREAGQSLWQVLPLGPTDFHGSPYSGLSAFAGNPLLISPDLLLLEGLLVPGDLAAPFGLAEAGAVDYPAASAWKESLLRRAFESFEGDAAEELREGYQAFCAAPEQGSWLEDWALFCTLRRRHRGEAWWSWPKALATRDPKALARAAGEQRREMGFHRFVQFLFDGQWRRLRSEAERRGILLLGDLPIYLARDSADVWAHQQLFQLDEAGSPLAVAGVPPDDFSSTGQLWGNPLYDWSVARGEGFSWWVDRVAADLRRFDLLRLDHFRGFEAYWRVPAGAETAETGSWEPGPGPAFFEALEGRFGDLPLIAENLGVITSEVEELRRRFRLPGTAVLQFAFNEQGTVPEHAPQGLAPDTAVYTGTHDNPTTASWYRDLPPEVRRQVDLCCGSSSPEIPWDLIRLVYQSPADLAVIPVQDFLGLGDEARMNTPGTTEGNWRWRLAEGALTPALARWPAELAEITGRGPS